MKNTSKTSKTVTHGTDSYSIPFYITCTISGLVKTYTSEEYINGKLDRNKGLANMIATYICRDAAKLKKAGKTNDEIKDILSKVVAVEAPAVPTDTPVSITETAPEVKKEIVVETKKPVAKQYANGLWRNAKGYPINKLLLNNYECIPYVAEKVA